MVKKHLNSIGSRIWRKISKAWKNMVQVPPMLSTLPIHPSPLLLNASQLALFLGPWGNGSPKVEMVGLFHEVGTTCTFQGEKQQGTIFFYANTPPFAWDPDRWKHLAKGYAILDHSTNFGRNPLSTGCSVSLEQWLSGTLIFLVITSAIGFIFGPLFTRTKSLHLCGQLAWSLWQSMIGGPTSHPSLFPHNAFFCLPNASELVKHKIWDCIQARKA